VYLEAIIDGDDKKCDPLKDGKNTFEKNKHVKNRVTELIYTDTRPFVFLFFVLENNINRNIPHYS